MTADWLRGFLRRDPHRQRSTLVPALPLLRHEVSAAPAAWLQPSLTTFGTSVASVLPRHFAGYARLHHPFEVVGAPPVGSGTWRELATRYGHVLDGPAAAEAFAYHGVPDGQAPTGNLPLPLIDVLLEYLRPATTTPEVCYFALWEGFGGTVVPPGVAPTFQLPHRGYHLFAGPLAAARVSYGAASFYHQSANLWWPADHAWCVATEVDSAWTYVGGSLACVAGLLADPRLDAAPTDPDAPW